MNILRLLRKAHFISEKHRIEWYPPFFMMRVKVTLLSDDWQQVRIKLPLNAFSKNMGDAMFGGYQASLADPIDAVACLASFPQYFVWTRAMSLDFVLEGNSDLELRFDFDPDIHRAIKQDLEKKGRSTPVFEYGYYRSDGRLCTAVKNTVAIRPGGYHKKTQKPK